MRKLSLRLLMSSGLRMLIWSRLILDKLAQRRVLYAILEIFNKLIFKERRRVRRKRINNRNLIDTRMMKLPLIKKFQKILTPILNSFQMMKIKRRELVNQVKELRLKWEWSVVLLFPNLLKDNLKVTKN